MATTARQLLDAIKAYTAAKSPEELLKELPDEQFRVAILASAELFKQMKDEAIRRGIWDELKEQKIT